MKYSALLALLFLACCVPEEEPRYGGLCVVYSGYNQIWVKSVTERPDGSLDVIDRDGARLTIKDFRSYECF